MADRYANFANSGLGRTMVKRLGLPDPPRLRRHTTGDPLTTAPVLLDAVPGGRLAEPVGKLLAAAGVTTTDQLPDGVRVGALVLDATGIVDSTQLRALYDFFHPYARGLISSGRVIVLGTPPETTASPQEATAQRSLEGLTRSIGKEFGRGVTAQLVYVAPGGETAVESTLRFLLSGRSAYVSGQVIRVAAGDAPAPADWERPLDGKLALVTGAARGIGAAIARVLARDGAEVIALDVPAAGDALADVANETRGRALQLDLTSDDAPKRLAGYLAAGPHGGVDIVVHNAGITRDKTIARMSADRWDSVLGVNLTAPERVNELLLERDLIPAGGRIVGVASIAGIAGNRGQTNYATSKAGVIGLVRSYAPLLADRDITINAVAPGFIETAMTARMPLGLREAGRRLNSMSQGGLPIDVAETIAWFASPGSATISGNVVRVCGQSLLGA
ncbi:3-oxoacyl-ACP reductase [Actinoplanes couchii]|uniref:3-oxoacyl-ACP reductase n=1 Tax=Actinoplanes couchii TaxID=403638 RepID=A0ABQ3X031_9ACTN|nr:3-oxoacyl-ACP reductase [Actinoplanes couchii]MDR6316260.1 3-oxoacyl-[acyl-carrier protein] reductase [Actinoplanes couchii]GID51874.1 3-oxoacyl-ACP reductase [Actinoplanes couchii]